MGAAVIAHGDVSPVFEASEHPFDAVSLAIEPLVVGYWPQAVVSSWNTGLDPHGPQPVAEGIAVVPSVTDQKPGWRESPQHDGGALVVTGLAFGQQQDQRLAIPIANRVQLGVQAAFRTSDAAG